MNLGGTAAAAVPDLTRAQKKHAHFRCGNVSGNHKRIPGRLCRPTELTAKASGMTDEENLADVDLHPQRGSKGPQPIRPETCARKEVFYGDAIARSAHND